MFRAEAQSARRMRGGDGRRKAGTIRMFDLLIKSGSVIDGSGAQPVVMDVGLNGDTITAMGDLAQAESRDTIDASGMAVCPGFIDAHSHSDAYLLIEPGAPSKIFQGITTEVIGNCGASAAPLVGDYHMPSDWRDKEYPGKWSSVSEYRQLLEQCRPALNAVLLIGHNTLRVGVAGYENRTLTEDELRRMKALLEKSLDEGGHGLSTGLIYTPGMYASTEEIIELAKVVHRHGGVYTSHMRSEGKKLLEAIGEAISIGKESGVRVEISHLKTAGRSNWGLVDSALDLIKMARQQGMDVCADRYPYVSGNTELDVIFPDWAEEGGPEATLARVKDISARARIRQELTAKYNDEDWAGITIGSTFHLDNRKYQGKPLVKVAENLGMEPVDAALYLVESDEVKTGAFFFGMSEDNMELILKEPYVMLGTDASLRSTKGVLSRDYPHPRAYGSFPKFLKMVRDKKMMPLEEAVRKMTSLPALQFGLQDRGLLEKGKKGDIVVFRPETITDMATYADPHRLSTGIEHLVVNGIHTIAAGNATGLRGGKFL